MDSEGAQLGEKRVQWGIRTPVGTVWLSVGGPRPHNANIGRVVIRVAQWLPVHGTERNV